MSVTVTRLGPTKLKNGKTVVLFFDEAGFDGGFLFYKSKNRRVYITREEADTPVEDTVNPCQAELLPAGWKIDSITENKPITTVGDLMDRLKNYASEVPVIIDAYEIGYQNIKNVYLHEVRKSDCAGGCIGEFEDSYIQDTDGHPAVIISRN